MGDCKYTLTKSTKDIGNCSFNVEVQNERRNGNNKVSFTRYVEVHLGKVHIRLDQDRKLFVSIYIKLQMSVLIIHFNQSINQSINQSTFFYN